MGAKLKLAPGLVTFCSLVIFRFGIGDGPHFAQVRHKAKTSPEKFTKNDQNTLIIFGGQCALRKNGRAKKTEKINTKIDVSPVG